MSNVQPTPGSTEPNPVSDGGSGDGSGGTGVPEGFVPAAELEAERQRARDFQARYDRLAAEKSAPAPSGDPKPKAKEGESPGFDLGDLRNSLLRDVYGANAMVRAADDVRKAFPHADPALFAPERLTEFSDPESLRFAAEESHRRVASILDTETQAIEAKIREELAAGAGSSGPGGSPVAPGADPSVEQILSMSDAEMDALEAASPGLIERVLMTAG
jgi:hypothetical protein